MKGEELARAKLLTEKGELENFMLRISGDFKSPSFNEEDSLDSLIVTERIQLERVIIKLRMIEESLLQIERGTYGICSKCGELIPQKRLEVLPGTNLCVMCAYIQSSPHARAISFLH